MQGYKLHVMTHAPYPEDKSSLPNGVYVLNTYTELKDGSRNMSVVFRNLTSKMIHLAPGRCVARVATANKLPAMLSQKQPDGKWHPIAFGSCELKGGEAKYHSSKLEFLALKWAITEQFREYLRYRPFTMLTDNNPLTYILTTPNLDALGHRWVATLASYNMTIRYLKGSDNKVADALSQIETRLDPETVAEFLNPHEGRCFPGRDRGYPDNWGRRKSGSGGHPPYYPTGSSR